jgi:hypothetical protein
VLAVDWREWQGGLKINHRQDNMEILLLLQLQHHLWEMLLMLLQ